MQKTIFLSITLSILLFSFSATAADITTVEDLCRLKPEIVQELFDRINLDYPGLEQVKQAVDNSDWPAACRALADYYRHSDTAEKLGGDSTRPQSERGESADSILQDVFTFQSVTGKQPRRDDGGLDWLNLGPRNDLEWAYFLNRHMIFVDLLGAWKASGDSKYSRHFDALIHDWVLANPAPEESEWTVNWRVLEAGLRMAWAWPESFYGFVPSEDMSPTAIILMLSSIHGHADYLKKYHWKEHNHAVMELFGLIKLALFWPEFKQSEEWLAYGMKHFSHELEFEVYPDGVQNELTSHYHGVPLVYFEAVMQLMEKSGRPVSSDFRTTVLAMYNYFAYTMRPDGNGLLNNDSDLDNNRSRVGRAAERYNRGDWSYIVNNGEQGTKPTGNASIVFPWAGEVVLRNGWSGDAQWAFFDAGPWGWSHQHNDKLHLSVSAYGRDILVDSGRYWYKPDVWRGYFLSSKAHNIVLIDGMVQKPDNKLTDTPITGNYALLPDFDFVISTFDKGFEFDKFSEEYGKEQIAKASGESVIGKPLVSDTQHTRALLYLKDRYYVVADMIVTPKPVEATALWHFHPDCTVVSERGSVASTDKGEGNVRIVPAVSRGWKVALSKGQEPPDIQGWYSVRYNEKEAESVASFSRRVNDREVFAWVIVPGRGKVAEPKVSVLDSPKGSIRLSVALPGEKATEIALRLDSSSPIPFGKGLMLDGYCGIVDPDGTVHAALGAVRDRSGAVKASHAFEAHDPVKRR